MAKKMAVNDLQVRKRAQGTKIELLSGGSVGTIRQGPNVGRKIFDPLDLMLRQQDGAEFRQVKPLVGGALNATEVKVERVNVHVGVHRRAPKKQEPPPKERLRALLLEQSGEMMTEFLPGRGVFVKMGSDDSSLLVIAAAPLGPIALENCNSRS